jgi:hypothetical protein
LYLLTDWKRNQTKPIASLGGWWLTLIILATQEAEIRRIVVQSQPREIVPEILSQKNPSKKKVSRVA